MAQPPVSLSGGTIEVENRQSIVPCSIGAGITSSIVRCYFTATHHHPMRGVSCAPLLTGHVWIFRHCIGAAGARRYFPSVGTTFIRHKFQMRSITAKLVLSAFSPSPGVR